LTPLRKPVLPLQWIATFLTVGLTLFFAACGGSSSTPPPPPPPPPASNSPFWAQWGSTAQHTGTVSVAAQALNRKLADIVYDPFVVQEQAEFSADLVAHFQAALTDGNDFYMESKSGTYPSCNPVGDWVNGTACGPNAWDQLVWNVTRYTWENGQPVLIWTFVSDWKPEPNVTNGLGGWEPVFHPVLANGFIYVPGAGGTVYKVDKNTGQPAQQIDPFAAQAIDKVHTYVSGPLTADTSGNIYYNVLALADPSVSDPWFVADASGAWLVRVATSDAASFATYASLVPNAPPAGGSNCPGTFFDVSPRPPFPWPPSPTDVPPTLLCGSQRPAVNVAPAVAPDGTIYTVSRAHFVPMVGYLVAVNPDLTPKWQLSFQHVLRDGCGVLLPIATDNTTPNSCAAGAVEGVDPTTNALGSGRVVDQASSTPTVLPDGAILFGVLDRYNFSRGHLFKIDAFGNFISTFSFGWDSTPAVYTHNGTYSIVIKDNRYQAAAYCGAANNPVCTPVPPGPYYITQLDAHFNVEWQFQNTTTDPNHPSGFEWCVNAPAIDSNGVVYANSEDGNVYAIPQGNTNIFKTPKQQLFLKQALGAAYTPLSIGPDGKLYVQNDGHLFIVGN
jgi:outer membrane protein assembly factor BamB